jgi:hypothetical protein
MPIESISSFHFCENVFFAQVSKLITSGNTFFVCVTESAGYPCQSTDEYWVSNLSTYDGPLP